MVLVTVVVIIQLVPRDHNDKGTKPVNDIAQVISVPENVGIILKRSCYDCHSNHTDYPWYAKLPGAKQLIDSDIAEAKEHLDMSKDFPFSGHASPLEDLEAIDKEVRDGEMPPFRYRFMHPSSKLTGQESKVVSEWVKNSLEVLNKNKD